MHNPFLKNLGKTWYKILKLAVRPKSTRMIRLMVLSTIPTLGYAQSLATTTFFEKAYAPYFETKKLSQNKPNSCLPEKITPRPLEFFLTKTQPNTLKVKADQLIQENSTSYQLLGNASLWQPGLLVFSPSIRLNRLTQQVQLGAFADEKSLAAKPQKTRPVTVFDTTLTVQAKEASINQSEMAAKTLTIDFAKYQLFPSQAYGTAEQIQINEPQNLASLDQANISICPSSNARGEGKKDWHLEFAKLKIDQQSKRVIGYHTVLKIRDMPVFYSPYFNYPLNDRATGFLFPDFGSYSSLTNTTTSTYVKIPYFINLAPNYDLTLSTLAMSQRGVLLDTEFRYLTRSDQQTHRLNLQAAIIDDQLTAKNGVATIAPDGTLEPSSPESKRWRINLDSHQDWGKGWQSQIQWHEVSDSSFYSDLPIDERFEKASEIRQHAILNYRSKNFHAYLQSLSFTALRTKRNLYQKRPELGVDWTLWQKQGWRLNTQATVSEFIADNAYSSLTPLEYEGVRAYVSPELSYQYSNIFSELKLSAKVHQRQYRLNHTQEASDLNQQITTPELSAYAALKFERQFQSSTGKAPSTALESNAVYTQTLKPELKYVYIPYDAQQFIPLFDSSARSLDFNNLFATNRFYGIDRIGDTHHLSYALSSELYAPSGNRIISIGAGQIAYLSNREITLSNDSLQEASFSDIYAKASLYLNRVQFNNTVKFEHKTLKFLAANSRLHWQTKPNQALFLHYNLERGSTTNYDNISIGGYTPISENTQLGLYHRYNLLNKQNESSQLRVRYQSCCWGLQLGLERNRLETGLSDTKLQLLFEFRGLSSQNNQNKLQESILGNLY